MPFESVGLLALECSFGSSKMTEPHRKLVEGSLLNWGTTQKVGRRFPSQLRPIWLFFSAGSHDFTLFEGLSGYALIIDVLGS